MKFTNKHLLPLTTTAAKRVKTARLKAVSDGDDFETVSADDINLEEPFCESFRKLLPYYGNCKSNHKNYVKN